MPRPPSAMIPIFLFFLPFICTFSRKRNFYLIGISECPKVSMNWVSVASSLCMPFNDSTACCTSKDICMFLKQISLLLIKIQFYKTIVTENKTTIIVGKFNFTLYCSFVVLL